MGGYLSYDKVGKGKSALTTAAVLNLKAEVYVIFVFFIISVSHDIKNDFDSVDPHLLFRQSWMSNSRKELLLRNCSALGASPSSPCVFRVSLRPKLKGREFCFLTNA